MANFGETLRKERESRGITLDTVVASTKISSRHLQFVEENRFDQLPGGVFNKGIIRNYARMLGLDEEEWLKRYLAATQVNDSFNEDDRNWTAFAENVGRSRGKEVGRSDSMLRWAGVLALLLFLGGFSWFVWGYVHHKNQSSGIIPQKLSLAMRD